MENEHKEQREDFEVYEGISVWKDETDGLTYKAKRIILLEEVVSIEEFPYDSYDKDINNKEVVNVMTIRGNIHFVDSFTNLKNKWKRFRNSLNTNYIDLSKN